MYYVIQLKDTSDPVTATSGLDTNSKLIYSPYLRKQAWRFVSYMFLHNGLVVVECTAYSVQCTVVPLYSVRRTVAIKVVCRNNETKCILVCDSTMYNVHCTLYSLCIMYSVCTTYSVYIVHMYLSNCSK